jgi:hypothetical protein
MEDASVEAPFCELAKNPWTALSHELDVGVKWKTKRLW